MRADGEGNIWIYILLGLAWLVLSFFQKKTQPPAPKQPMPKDTWDDPNEWEILTEEPPKEPYNVEQNELQTPKSEKFTTHEMQKFEVTQTANAYFIPQFEGSPVFTYEDEIQKTEIRDIDKEVQESNNFHFDVRQAVVFSEILNKRYS